MQHRLPITLVLVILSLVTVAQQRTHINAQLNSYLQRNEATNTMVDLYLRGDEQRLTKSVIAAGGTVKMRMKDLVSVRVPASMIRTLASDPAVNGIEFSLAHGQVMNDSMRVHNRINEVHAGMAPLPSAYDGKGVLMGIIDTGLDMAHPDFLDTNGRTRVLKYWDQRFAFDTVLTPLQWGYGQVWDSTAINAGQCPATDQPQYFGHGTTVTGTACGNGLATGNYKGAAPASDMIIVSNKLNAVNWRSTIADAVHFIANEAQALGRPCVINASLGEYLGSHDGLDASALFIDSILNATPGLVMVCAAGNSGAFPNYHLRTSVTSDTSFTWFTYNPTSALGYGAVYFDLWADSADFSNVQYAIGADHNTTFEFRGSTPFRDVANGLGTVVSDTLWSLDNNLLGVVDYFAELRGAQYHVEVHIKQPDSSQYMFRFMSTGAGAYDVWTASFFGFSGMVSNIPTATQMPAIIHYVLPDGEKKIVDSWACSPHVITVANYWNETSYVAYDGSTQSSPTAEGDIVANSSSGPRRQDALKPDIAATGDVTLTAGPLPTLQSLIANEPHKVAPDGMHMRNGGTSMASPVVAGAVALYLEKCPYAPHSEIIAALTGTATADNFTGAVPNKRWGHGKLHAFNALTSSNFNVSLSLFGDSTYCEGDSIMVSGPAGMYSYLWSNGDSVEVIHADQPGPIHLMVQGPSGCSAWSDTLTLIEFPAPADPVITQLGSSLESSPAPAYQWFFQGNPIAGAVMQTYTATISGDYFVQIIDTNNCTANSDTVQIIITGVPEIDDDGLRVWPDPASQELFISVPSGHAIGEFKLLDVRGRVVEQWRATGQREMMISVTDLAPGTYQVHFQSDGQRWVQRFSKH